jgi:hypothetical protein
MLRNGLPSCFLFRGMVRNRIQRVCFYVCSTKRNSELFSLLRNGSERNSESFFCSMVQNSEHFSLLQNDSEWNCESCFYFCSTVQIPSIFIFHEMVGNGIPRVSFPRKSRNSAEQTNCSVIFCLPQKNFLSEIANSTCKLVSYITMKLSQVSVPALLYTDSSFRKMCM